MENFEKSVCNAIKLWLRQNDMTMTDMAKQLGVGLSAVTNQLNNRKFGRNNADKYHEAFGFDVTYLLTGVGHLFPDEQDTTPVLSQQKGVFIPQETLELYTNLSESLRIMSGLVERYAPRETSPVKKGISPLDYLGK